VSQYTVSIDAEADLDDFDLEDIADYLRQNGYMCVKDDEHVEFEKFPEPMKSSSAYIAAFCKLNNLHLT